MLGSNIIDYIKTIYVAIEIKQSQIYLGMSDSVMFSLDSWEGIGYSVKLDG